MTALAVGAIAVAHTSLLARFHLVPGPLAWTGLAAANIGGWYLNPGAWVSISMLTFGFWVGVGRRHPLRWHIGLLTSHVAPFLVVGGWIRDWARFWWIHLPNRPAEMTVPCPTIWHLWDSPIWGGTPLDRLGVAALIASGLAGAIGRFAAGRHRATAGLFLVAGGTLAVAVSGLLWAPLRPFGNDQVLFASVCLTVVPAAHATASFASWVVSCPTRRCGAAALTLPGLVVAFIGLSNATSWDGYSSWGPRPLVTGRPSRAESFVRWSRETLSPAARLLWEDGCELADETWTVLLAHWAKQPFIGGMNASIPLEHGFITLRSGTMVGRSIATWTDQELELYCRRYNVGWVACATDAAKERFSAFPLATRIAGPTGWGSRWFFEIQRSHDYVISGQARTIALQPQRVVLTDIVPENGAVLLSLHYQRGWRARPAWVRVEREPDPFDPIPFVRLRVPGPAARVTLTWEGP